MVDGAAASGYNSTVEMKMKASKVTNIHIELDEREAMILAKILCHVGGNHEWTKFTFQLYDTLLQCVDYEEFCEYTEGVIKQPMILEK